MDRKNVSPQGETARVLTEFLEVAVNCIVFLKGFYPPAAFERRRYMNVVVQKARHPQLADYIRSATSNLLPFLQKVVVDANISYNAREGRSYVEIDGCHLDKALRGKTACTKFTRISTNGKYSLVLCQPVTGRTHQEKSHFNCSSYYIHDNTVIR